MFTFSWNDGNHFEKAGLKKRSNISFPHFPLTRLIHEWTVRNIQKFNLKKPLNSEIKVSNNKKWEIFHGQPFFVSWIKLIDWKLFRYFLNGNSEPLHRKSGKCEAKSRNGKFIGKFSESTRSAVIDRYMKTVQLFWGFSRAFLLLCPVRFSGLNTKSNRLQLLFSLCVSVLLVFYWALLGYTGFLRVLPGFTVFFFQGFSNYLVKGRDHPPDRMLSLTM